MFSFRCTYCDAYSAKSSSLLGHHMKSRHPAERKAELAKKKAKRAERYGQWTVWKQRHIHLSIRFIDTCNMYMLMQWFLRLLVILVIGTHVAPDRPPLQVQAVSKTLKKKVEIDYNPLNTENANWESIVHAPVSEMTSAPPQWAVMPSPLNMFFWNLVLIALADLPSSSVTVTVGDVFRVDPYPLGQVVLICLVLSPFSLTPLGYSLHPNLVWIPGIIAAVQEGSRGGVCCFKTVQ